MQNFKLSKSSAVGLILAISLVCFLPGPAAAVLITVDESGAGTLVNDSGETFTLPSALQPDPGPGGLSSVLTYDMLGPPALTAGDVLLQDGPGGPVLDVVRFNPAGTGGNPSYPASLLFYSDNVEGFDSRADTPSPPTTLYPNNVTILESGAEGNNRAVYTPLSGQPGFVSGFVVTYTLISDGSNSVPEPTALALLATGWAAIGALKVFRRR